MQTWRVARLFTGELQYVDLEVTEALDRSRPTRSHVDTAELAQAKRKVGRKGRLPFDHRHDHGDVGWQAQQRPWVAMIGVGVGNQDRVEPAELRGREWLVARRMVDPPRQQEWVHRDPGALRRHHHRAVPDERRARREHRVAAIDTSSGHSVDGPDETTCEQALEERLHVGSPPAVVPTRAGPGQLCEQRVGGTPVAKRKRHVGRRTLGADELDRRRHGEARIGYQHLGAQRPSRRGSLGERREAVGVDGPRQRRVHVGQRCAGTERIDRLGHDITEVVLEACPQRSAPRCAV